MNSQFLPLSNLRFYRSCAYLSSSISPYMSNGEGHGCYMCVWGYATLSTLHGMGAQKPVAGLRGEESLDSYHK